MERFFVVTMFAMAVFASSCNDAGIDVPGNGDESSGAFSATLEDVAVLLSETGIGRDQMQEVHDAVSLSSGNGYDEEYMMKDLFANPGAGVGCDASTKADAASKYPVPLRELIRKRLISGMETRSAAGAPSPEEFLDYLENSDLQIYWPYSENWNGTDMPVITFDPEDNSDRNIGFRLCPGENQDDFRIEEIIVDEEFAKNTPVWVINRNEDSGYSSLEILRREDPSWGSGGTVIVRPKSVAANPSSAGLKTLILKDFTMNRNFDSWFAGASEFFVKTGSVENFTASTEAELRLYSPTVTDFMIVVRRNQVGKPQPFNAVLVSDWTDQLTNSAFMIIEDDGGTRTTWKCSAVVKVQSKSYGFEISIPLNTKDDIVWRGSLSSRYLLENNNVSGHFGDVDLTFEILGQS